MCVCETFRFDFFWGEVGYLIGLPVWTVKNCWNLEEAFIRSNVVWRSDFWRVGYLIGLAVWAYLLEEAFICGKPACVVVCVRESFRVSELWGVGCLIGFSSLDCQILLRFNGGVHLKQCCWDLCLHVCVSGLLIPCGWLLDCVCNLSSLAAIWRSRSCDAIMLCWYMWVFLSFWFSDFRGWLDLCSLGSSTSRTGTQGPRLTGIHDKASNRIHPWRPHSG